MCLFKAESTSDHPLAEAIVTALEGEEQVIPAHLDGFENITGKGVRVAYQGAEYWVGSHKLLKDYQANLSDILADMLTQYESDEETVLSTLGVRTIYLPLLPSRTSCG